MKYKVSKNWYSLQDFFNICDFLSEDERASLLELHYYIEHCFKILEVSTFKNERNYYIDILPKALNARDTTYTLLVNKYKLEGREVEFKYYKELENA